MAIYKRKDDKSDSYYIDFIAPNGKRVRQSAGTSNKQQAQELHDKLKAQSWRVKNVGDKPRYSWQQAVVRWLSENDHKKSLRVDKDALRYFDQHLSSKMLDEITKSLVDEIKTHKKTTGLTNGTVNRNLAVLRSILIAAKNEWEWIDSYPKVKMLPLKNERVRWLTQDEVARLFKELPAHTKVIAQFSLATGLRTSNVLNLQWANVDMQKRCAWVDAENTKSGKAIAIPLNDDAMSVLRSQIGKHETHVFTYAKKPVTVVNTLAWRKALKRAGIENFKYHDLRHTWASWHVQNGTPLHVLKELGGWSDLKMVLRYAHLSSQHLAGYAGNSSSNGGIMAHQQKSPVAEIASRA